MRRRVVWANAQYDQVHTTAGSTFAQDCLAQYRALSGTVTVGITVLRTIVQLWSVGDISGTAIPRGNMVAYGLIREDFNGVDVYDGPIPWAGIFGAAVPMDWHAGWAWEELQVGTLNGVGSGESSFDNRAGRICNIDVRSRRKITDVGTTWWLVVNTPFNSDGIHIQGTIRTLLALP